MCTEALEETRSFAALRMTATARRPSARPPAGFTILEAVVAMTIIGLVAVSMLATFGAELRASDRARTVLEMESLAEERYAGLLLLGPAALRQLADSLREGSFAAPFDRYHWTATAHQAEGQRDLVNVAVEVSWEGGRYPLTGRLFRPLPRGPHAH